MDISQIIAVIANTALVVAAGVGIIQLKRMKFYAKAEYERKMKQSTIDVCVELDKIQHELETMMADKGIKWPIPIESLNIDPELEACLIRYLNTIENIAVGTNAEVYDFKILNFLIGNYLTNKYNELHTYIEQARVTRHYTDMYGDFVRLVNDLNDYRSHPDDDAVIKNNPLKKKYCNNHRK